MMEGLKELVISNREQEFNQELGMVGDYLEEMGDPEYKVCRVHWRIFPDPDLKRQSPFRDPERTETWIRFGFPPDKVCQQMLRDVWMQWKVNSTPLLFFPPRSMSICNLPPYQRAEGGRDEDQEVGFYWVVEGLNRECYKGYRGYDFHEFFP